MKHLKYFCIGLAVTLSPILANCGGDSGGGGSPSGSSGNSSSSGPTILSTISASITSAAPKVTLANIATVDFTGQAVFVNSQVQISSVVDSDLNAFSKGMEGLLSADFSATNTIEIEVVGSPVNPIPITIFYPQSWGDTPDGQVPTMYYYDEFYSSAQDRLVDYEERAALGDTEAGDGGNSLYPIPTSSDDSTREMQISLPIEAFHSEIGGKYKAYLKVGIAEGSKKTTASGFGENIKVRSAASNATVATFYMANIPKLPCPVAAGANSAFNCIETSRFNPSRNYSTKLNKNGRAEGHHPHNGMDIRASENTDIYLPSGGIPLDTAPVTYTKDDFEKDVQRLLTNPCPNLTPAQCQSNAEYYALGTWGISLAVRYTKTDNYEPFALRIVHLNSISNTLLTGVAINRNARTQRTATVGKSGGTGVGKREPHLHYELYARVVPSTVKLKTGTIIRYAITTVIDPFPFIVNKAVLTEASCQSPETCKPKLKDKSQFDFKFYATDMDGNYVYSEINSKKENAGIPPPKGRTGDNTLYSPSRKACLTAFPQTTLRFPSVDNIKSFVGYFDDYCVSWPLSKSDGTPGTISATKLTNSPSTTVSGNFSYNADLSLKDDPEVITGATLDLIGATVLAHIDVSPTSVVSGAPATLTWSSENATNCTASGAWSGAVVPNGSALVTPSNVGVYEYGISCAGAGGPASSTANLTVTALPNTQVVKPGDYVGTYTCAQGLTQVTIKVFPQRQDGDGQFIFSSASGSGSFTINVSGDANNMVVTPGHWIQEPVPTAQFPHWFMVGATLKRSGNNWDGTISGTGCGAIHVVLQGS